MHDWLRLLQQQNLHVHAETGSIKMDYMAECVRQNKAPYTPGEVDRQDQRIMEAIYQSARENRLVKLPAGPRIDACRGPLPTADDS